MGITKFILVIVHLVALFPNYSHSTLVDDVRSDVIKQLETAWKQLGKINREGKSPAELLTDLSKLLRKIPESISRVEREIAVYEYEDAIKSLTKVQNTSDTWRSKWSEIAILTSPVDVLYGHFKLFPEMPESFAPGSKQMDFDANTITDLILNPLYNTDEKGTITLSYLVEHAHTMVTSRREKNSFSVLADYIDEALSKSYWCLWNGKTPQRIIYGFYISLLSLDIKQYTLKNFAWMIRDIINRTDSTTEVEHSINILKDRAAEKLAFAKTAMAEASPAFWQCDPSKYIEGETFAQFQELLSGYIENEVNMHPSGSCKQSCGDFSYTKAKCNEPDDDTCFRRRICTGTLVDCQYINADATVCLADTPRRFDYIDYKKGPRLGKDGKCAGVTERRDSYWRLFYHCSNCFCLCDDPKSPTTVRQVSLLPVTSDVDSNKIVTGVRLQLKHKVLHLQIEEGVPEKYGAILEGSTEWKSIPRVTKNDDKVATLDYINRAFDLDDILVPNDYVVTGVRFRNLGSHINLEVQATQINPQSGELIPGSSHWISNDNTPEARNQPRQELILEEPDVPTLTKLPSVPDSVHDQYINFGATGRSVDVSQTTVPFLDIQAVRPNPPVWLQGIGIYHKSQPKYGGFLAPRIFTRSAAEFLKP